MNQLKNIGKQKIGKYEFTGIEGGFGKEKKAMLAKDIAEIHAKEVRQINQAINMNKKRFIENIDIIDLKKEDFAINLMDSGFNQSQINASKNIYLLSERGYAKLLKILEDDKAWEIYDELVDNYFNMRAEQIKLPTTTREVMQLLLKNGEEANERIDKVEEDIKQLKEEAKLDTGDYNAITSRVKKRVYEVARAYGWNNSKEVISTLFKDINSGIKRIAHVEARTQLQVKHYRQVMDFINDWEPSVATRYEINQTKLDV